MPALISLKPTEELRGVAAAELTGAGLMAMDGVGDLADSDWDEETGVGFWERDEDDADGLAPVSTDGMGISGPGIP